MGFEHMISEMISKPGEFAVSWVVLLTLVIMSAMSWYWTVINALKNTRLKSQGDRVTTTFWETPNAQDAIRLMEEQPRNEPFSKIALDAAMAAAHHQRQEGTTLAESLSRSEFVDRALRQAVTRESARLQSGMTLLATVGATAPFVGLLGTVWGIYGALIRIGATGQASIDAVSRPGGRGADHDCHRSVRRHPGGVRLQLLRQDQRLDDRQVRHVRPRSARLLRHRLARALSRGSDSHQHALTEPVHGFQ